MATYAQLQTRILRRVIDAPSAISTEVPDLINSVIRELEDDHNYKVMETETTFNTATTRILAVVPSDFKEFRNRPYFLTDNGVSSPMSVAPDRESMNTFVGANTTTDIGSPLFLLDAEPSDDDNTRNLEVFPVPDGNSDFSDGEYRVHVPFWKYLPDLSADGDANWFSVNAERYIIAKVTADALFMNWDEERGSVWEARAARRLQRVMSLDKKARLGGVRTLAIHLGANAPQLRF